MNKSLLLALACILVCVLFANAENANPAGYPTFDPDTVWEVKVGEPAIYNKLENDTIHYYWATIPNTGGITININSFNFSNGCDSWLAYIVNLGDAEDLSEPVGFGCWENLQGSNFCKSWWYGDTLGPNTGYTVVAGYDGYYPGNKVFITLQEETPSYVCDYSIDIQIYAYAGECDDDEVPNANYQCSSYTEMDENEEKTGTLAYEEVAIYRLDIPKNTARINAQIKSTGESTWYASLSAGVVSESIETLGSYKEGSMYVSEWQETEVPYGPAYILISSDTDGADYTLRVWFDVCDDDETGYTSIWDSPLTESNPGDCRDDKIKVHIPKNFPKTITVKDVINTTPGAESSGPMLSMDIPEGTFGWLNISCVTSDPSSDAWVAVGYGFTMANCDGDYTYEFGCGPYWENYGYTSYTTVLSQTLYGGPDLQFIVCVSDETPVDVTITIDGSVELPQLDSAPFTQVGLISLVVLMLVLFF